MLSTAWSLTIFFCRLIDSCERDTSIAVFASMIFDSGEIELPWQPRAAKKSELAVATINYNCYC